MTSLQKQVDELIDMVLALREFELRVPNWPPKLGESRVKSVLLDDLPDYWWSLKEWAGDCDRDPVVNVAEALVTQLKRRDELMVGVVERFVLVLRQLRPLVREQSKGDERLPAIGFRKESPPPMVKAKEQVDRKQVKKQELSEPSPDDLKEIAEMMGA